MKGTVLKNMINASGRKTLAVFAALGAAVLMMATPVQSQTIYKVLGADGKVTFSDQPPVTTSGKASAVGTGAGPSDAAGAALPYALRQVANNYPVTLYTTTNCAPCGSGRAMLRSRGIPFSEKTITTNEDAAALQRISSDSSLPFLTIGSQQIKGYSDSEWTQFLNAAGYPRTSVLPASYRHPEATPLVLIQKPAATTKPEPAPAPAASPPPPVDPGSNPAGIKF